MRFHYIYSLIIIIVTHSPGLPSSLAGWAPLPRRVGPPPPPAASQLLCVAYSALAANCNCSIISGNAMKSDRKK